VLAVFNHNARCGSLLLKFRLSARRHPADATAGEPGTSHRDEASRMGRKLYSGNLPYELGEPELQDLLGRTGSRESLTVMRDQVGGRNVTVNEARPKEAPSGGGIGGGRRRRAPRW
jgi:hypothetical protein